MHESYNANNPMQFSRSWFCWADTLFSEFVMSMIEDPLLCSKPDLFLPIFEKKPIPKVG